MKLHQLFESDMLPSETEIGNAEGIAYDAAAKMEAEDPAFESYREDGYDVSIDLYDGTPHVCYWSRQTGDFAFPVRTNYRKGRERDQSDTWYLLVHKNGEVDDLHKKPKTWEDSSELKKLQHMNSLHDENLLGDRIEKAKLKFEQENGWVKIPL